MHCAWDGMHGTVPSSGVPSDGGTTCKSAIGASSSNLFGLSEKGPDPETNKNLMWDGMWDENQVDKNK